MQNTLNETRLDRIERNIERIPPFEKRGSGGI
jgi:hypothetical protein